MAIYQFQRGKGYAHNVIDHFNYIRRDEKYKNYEKDKQQVEYVEHKFYPSNCTPKEFWENAEHYERVNGLVYHKFQFALPHELSKYEHIDLVRDFCKNNFEDYPHTMVIHNDPKTNNPHAHIMVCPRKNDGIEIEPSQYFKRYNSKNQENGGFKKSDHFNDLGHYYEIRRSWEQTGKKSINKM